MLWHYHSSNTPTLFSNIWLLKLSFPWVFHRFNVNCTFCVLWYYEAFSTSWVSEWMKRFEMFHIILFVNIKSISTIWWKDFNGDTIFLFPAPVIKCECLRRRCVVIEIMKGSQVARGGFQSVRRSVVHHHSLLPPRLQDLDRRCFDKAVSSAPYLSQLRYIVTRAIYMS